MKAFRRTFDTTGEKVVPIDAYADKGVSVDVVSGGATIQTTITQINAEGITPVAFDSVTLPGKIDYAITGLIVTVSSAPCVIDVAQHGT